MFKILCLIFVGSGLGGVLRHLFIGLSKNCFGEALPYGTLLVNCLGSLLCVYILSASTKNLFFLSEEHKIFLTVGLAGGFTTFSTFSADIIEMLKDHNIYTSLLYVFLMMMLTLICGLLGFYLSRYPFQS